MKRVAMLVVGAVLVASACLERAARSLLLRSRPRRNR